MSHTAFQVGDRVRFRSNVPLGHLGARGAYRVFDVHQWNTPFGMFVTYCIENTVDPDDKRDVANGHLVLEAVDNNLEPCAHGFVTPHDGDEECT